MRIVPFCPEDEEKNLNHTEIIQVGKEYTYNSNSLVKSKGQCKGANVSKRLLMKPTHTLSWKAVFQVPTSNQTVMCSMMLASQVNTGIQMLVSQYPVDSI
jgi:hypothetical protein